MRRRKFSREFKLEAVRLVQERGVSLMQAARDLDLHERVLRKWIRAQDADPVSPFPGNGQRKPEQLELEQLRREVTRLKAERDILKKPRPTSRRTRCEMRVDCEAPGDLAGRVALCGARGLAQWIPCLARAWAEHAGPQ